MQIGQLKERNLEYSMSQAKQTYMHMLKYLQPP